ncbi:MAG: AsnC family transcriptional regulator [Streptosporangiales bacterium]|nr:AsnC family transcriptional regulator [Streptosporangiales bacterium]
MQEGDDVTPDALLREGDLELIDALQINPRATWAEIGDVLGVDAVTVARRWKRLERDGLAWSTVALGRRRLDSMAVAFLELTCEAGAAVGVAERLARLPYIFTVQHVAGSYDLFAIAVAPDLSGLSGYVLHELPGLEGVRRARTHVATRSFDLSMGWRLRVLNPAQVALLRPDVPVAGGPRDMDDQDRALFVALSVDGRRGYRDLAAELGTTARTVQRRLNRLIATGDISFRCDLARSLAGWHASAVLWLSMPDDRLEATAAELLRWRETRTCAAVAGPYNLLLTVGLHTLSDLHGVVSRLRKQFPYASIVDRQVVMRQVKLYGRVLDPAGRWTSRVPLDPWALQASPP